MSEVSRTHFIEVNLRKNRVPYFNLVKKHEVKKKIISDMKIYNEYLLTTGLGFESIVIVDRHEDDELITKERNDNFDKQVIEIRKKSKKEEEAFIVQCARDLANMSEKSYINFRDALKPICNLPCISNLNIMKNRMNRVFPVSNNLYGSYVNSLRKIEFVLNRVHDQLRGEIKNDEFRIQYCGDGTMVSKSHVNLLTFSFSVMNVIDISFHNQNVLAHMEIKSENYENIENAYREIKDIIKNFNSITIKGKNYKIVNYAGGDLKYNAIVIGIKAANADHACPCCKVDLSQPVDINAEWTLDRSHEEALVFLGKKESERCGYKNKAILDFIPMSNFGICTLHMPARLMEKLYDHLIDYIEVSVDKDCSDNLSKRPVFKKLWNFIEEDCKISNPFYIKMKNNGDSKIKMRKTINKNEKHQIFLKMFEFDDINKKEKSLLDFFPKKYHNHQKLQVLNMVIKEYIELIQFIMLDHTDTDTYKYDEEILKIRLRHWLSYFLILKEKISVYVHIFVFHVPELIRIYRYLNLFSMQGLENLHCKSKLYYFRQSNKKKKQWQKQLLQKQNRMEFIYHKGKLDELPESNIDIDVISAVQ